MAVEILVEEIRKKRRRELDAYPLARLEDTTFKTRYGVKKRPHFAVVGWVFPGGERLRRNRLSQRLRPSRRRQRKRLPLRRPRAPERRLRLAR
jgi:hypothetical protein